MTQDRATQMVHRWAAWSLDIEDRHRIKRVEIRGEDYGDDWDFPRAIVDVWLTDAAPHEKSVDRLELDYDLADVIREILDHDTT